MIERILLLLTNKDMEHGEVVVRMTLRQILSLLIVLSVVKAANIITIVLEGWIYHIICSTLVSVDLARGILTKIASTN